MPIRCVFARNGRAFGSSAAFPRKTRAVRFDSVPFCGRRTELLTAQTAASSVTSGLSDLRTAGKSELKKLFYKTGIIIVNTLTTQFVRVILCLHTRYSGLVKEVKYDKTSESRRKRRFRTGAPHYGVSRRDDGQMERREKGGGARPSEARDRVDLLQMIAVSVREGAEFFRALFHT